MPQDQKMVDPN